MHCWHQVELSFIFFVQYAFHLERKLNMWASFEERVLTEDPFACRVRVRFFQYAVSRLRYIVSRKLQFEARYTRQVECRLHGHAALCKVLAEYDLQLCACSKKRLLRACVPARVARGYTPRLHLGGGGFKGPAFQGTVIEGSRIGTLLTALAGAEAKANEIP